MLSGFFTPDSGPLFAEFDRKSWKFQIEDKIHARRYLSELVTRRIHATYGPHRNMLKTIELQFRHENCLYSAKK